MRNGFVGDAVVGRSERPWAKEELAAATRCQCLGALVSQKNAPCGISHASPSLLTLPEWSSLIYGGEVRKSRVPSHRRTVNDASNCIGPTAL